MTNNKYFEVERITNGASGEKRTTKTFKDEEKAIAYAKRYHRTTKTIKSVKTTVYYFNGTDTGITYRANTKDGTEKDYREQATEVKPDEQTTEEKEYIFFSPKTGRYAARRFRGTEEAVIADTERRIEERDYARDFCLVIREVISKGNSRFVKAINWNDDYRIACGWYSEIVYSKEEAMKKAEELANKEKKEVNVYITTLNNDGHAVEKLIDTVKPFKGQTYEINGRWFTLATEEEAVNLAQSMANDKNRVVRINRNGVEIAEVKPEQKYNFYITDYTEDRELPTFYEGYTKKEITNMVKEWSEKNNHVYKIYIYDRTSDKGIAGRVFFKVINWKQIYKVGKTGSRLRFGEFLYEEAEKYCKEYAKKDGIAYTIYEVKLDEYGRDDTVQVINIEPPEKIVYYGVRGYSHTFDTLDEAQTFAKNQRSKSELIIYKAIEIDNGLRTTLKQVDVIPAYSAKQHTHYELEINEYDETGYITNENTVKFKTLEEATAYVDKLIKNAGENEIVLRLYKVTGEDFECLFTKRASKIHGTIGILEDKPGQTVAEVKPEPEPTPKIKTLQDWEKKGGNFTDFCKVGDKVDKGIVDYFVDVLPPITWRTDLVQCGEPYGHRDNPKTGRWEAMYITFAKNDNGQWYYAGICFLNQREAIA